MAVKLVVSPLDTTATDGVISILESVAGGVVGPPPPPQAVTSSNKERLRK